MTKQYHEKDFSIYNGDCVRIIREIPDNTVHFNIFSPPFANLYIYSNDLADMGNCKDIDEFFEQFDYLIPELYRITKPGRLCAVHCKQLVKYKGRDGRAGLTDFRGKIIEHFEKFNWQYHSEVTIWTDPVLEMQKTKAHGLLYKQVRKDASFSRQGLPDYLVIFRKWAEEDEEDLIEPVEHTKEDFPLPIWQNYASPVWMDIQRTDVLNVQQAREDKDEKHICLAEGTLVLTQRGYIPIEDVEIGDLTLTHKGNWKPILAKKLTRENTPVVQTHAQGVPHLITTPDHRIWAREGKEYKPKETMRKAEPNWVESQNLDIHYVNQKLPPIMESQISEKEWWIIGRWLADGHLDARGHQYFISVGKDKWEEFESMAKGYIGAQNDKGSSIQVGLINLPKDVRDILAQSGRGAENKQLSLEAMSLNKELSEALLQGYLSGDGNKTGNQHSASSVSRPLLLGMAMVVQRAREFIPSIFAGKKAGEYEIEGRKVNQKQLWVMAWRENTRHNFSEILEDGAWKKVRKVESEGNADVWSIRVADDESFTAEGCIVKNCPLQLDVIERAIDLWTNKGDIVFSPFMGIGSEIYTAVKMGRKGIGIELKESYFENSYKNIMMAVQESNQVSIFDLK
ncbi:DNA methyltransferase [Tissierella praeacuta]|uniref:DNA methyltransferase n=1 Tax=Tissierella praeacuta TaxID=43131 RepID=UPI001045BAD3|nr:DNA methyltransferase [Tissierella praeacuta]TCU72878.1 intein [Tissierella praeacuta]